MSSTKTLSIFLKLNSKAFTSSLKKVEGKLSKLGNKLSSIGSSMTSSISLPLLGLGAIAIKTASDFEASMTKIQTLVGLPKDTVDALAESVKDLAGTTATGPQELADGLYFLTSAGLDAASAMKALEAVAKGSVSGLGDMESLSVVAAAAQNAYGEEVLSASKALDIFGTMVQTGMFKSEELANVLGSQLGLAANLGIEMEELGAMISTYTRTTGSATDATTGLSGIMMSFAKITPKAEKALADATKGMKGGAMSAKDLKKFLGEKGLQATLQMLQEQFKKSGIPLSEFFSKSQALKGVLGVLGNQTEDYVDILKEMEDAQGFVNEAFDETSETSAFKFKQSMADLKVAGIELGDSLLPIATKIADKLSGFAKSFSGLSEESREKIVKMGLALIAIGPTLFIVGNLIKLFGFLVTAIRLARTATIAFGAAVKMINPVGAAIAAIIGLIVLIVKNWDKVKVKLVDVINWFIELYNENMAFKVAVEGLKFAFKSVWNYVKFFFKQVKTVLGGVGAALEAIWNWESPVTAFKNALGDMEQNAKDFVEKTADEFDTMKKNIKTKDKVELIDVEDIDNFTGDVKEKMTGLLNDLTGALGIQDVFKKEEELDLGEVDNLTIDANEIEIDGDAEVEVEPKVDKDKLDEQLREVTSATQNAFTAMANASPDDEDSSVVDNIKKQTRDIIAAKTAEAVASFAGDAFAKFGILGAVLAAAAGTVVGGLFAQIIPPFAQGGLVAGPTLAMVGEGSGTSSINPEVIAPLDKLRGMIGAGGGGRLHGSISGSNILLSNDRSTSSRYRVSGSTTNF